MASRLSDMQARFQQRQIQEKEEKLVRMYENQQQRTIEKVNRSSAGSTTSVTSANNAQGGKVRQMFDERRQKAGIDRSYPLEPLRKTPVGRNGTVQKTPETISKSSGNIARPNVPRTNGKILQNRSFAEERLHNNNNNTLNKTYVKQKDLEVLWNGDSVHNLDDETLPDFGIDEFDEPLKPSPTKNGQYRVVKKPEPTIVKNGYTAKTTNAAKPVVVKRATPQRSSSRQTPLSSASPSDKNRSAVMPAPSSSSRTSQPIMGNRKAPSETKTPSIGRPSSKAAPRGPSSVNRDDLEACRYCNRRFAADRLSLHEDICAKTMKKKRKLYDATRHRVQGTELEQYVRKGTRTGNQKEPTLVSRPQLLKKSPKSGPPKTDWRRKHEEFISAIRAAKMAQAHVAAGGKLADLPPPPPSSNPDYVQCPHCGRRFNATAAERHIPKCATYEFNKPKSQMPKIPNKPSASSRGTLR